MTDEVASPVPEYKKIIRPALTPDEWAWLDAGGSPYAIYNTHRYGVMIIAVTNHNLPNDNALKITHADLAALEEEIESEHTGTGGRLLDSGAALAALATKLRALLPPTP